MKSRRRSGTGSVELVREDWDFESCPEGREQYCWGYEYARESDVIVADYRESMKHGTPGEFDEHGNLWRTITILDVDGELEEQIGIELPPGFPEEPYLRTAHVPWRLKGEPLLDLEELIGWSVMDAEKVKHYRPPPTQPHFAHLYVCWEEADKTLVKDFRRWLKANRPFPAKTRRGKSSAREFMADLKALGAYRLMRAMGVAAAMEHTASIRRGNPLFLKRPDWYKAQRRARAVIERYFDRG